MQIFRNYCKLVLALWLGAFALTANGHAQGTPITTQPGANWTHEPSGTVIPAAMAGLVRGEMRDLSRNQSDVLIQFRSADTQTLATVYVYRTGYRDLGIWFDQAYSAISTNPGLGPRSGDASSPDLITLFGGSTPDSGVVAFPVQGNYRSTGLGMTERNGWLIKVRLSSQRVDQQGNENLIRAVLTSLDLPERVVESAPPRNINACATRMAESTGTQIDPTGVMSLMGPIVLSSLIQDVPTEACLNNRLSPVLGVYRQIANDTGYVIGFGDAGKAVLVTRLPDDIAPNTYEVDLLSSDEGLVIAFFEGMPSPQQALQAANAFIQGQSRAISSVSYPPIGEGAIINVSPDMIENTDEAPAT